MRAVAGAEPPSLEVAGVGDGDTAQVRADTKNHQDLHAQ